MRPINLNNVTETAEGEFSRIKPGAYPCAIMKVEDVPDREYMWVVVDVCAGEFKDYFSDSYYDDKDYAHRLCFSYKEKALPMLKGRLHVISDCNPGFDAEAAINAGKEQMLVGKAVGVVFREEEFYNKKEDEFQIGGARPDRLCRLDELTLDKNASPKPKMLSDQRKREALMRAGEDPDEWMRAQKLKEQGVAPSQVYGGDVPFDM